MKFMTYLCLIIYVTQISVADRERRRPLMKYYNIDIDASNLQIPENTWWYGRRGATQSDDTYAYDWIEYQKDIPKDSLIRLDYTVQYAQAGFISIDWVNLFHDSVLLCDRTENTQDASIIALVQKLLGIPEGCPVSAGDKRNTSGIQFPFKNQELLFNSDITDKNIRILTNMWGHSTDSAERLFMGHFYMVYPATLLKFSHLV